MEFEWKIVDMQSRSADGFVVNVCCNVIAKDGDLFKNIHLNVSYEQTESTFVPFDQLTEEMVVQWVQQSSGKEKTEQMLALQIEAEKNPPLKNGVPWSSEKEGV